MPILIRDPEDIAFYHHEMAEALGWEKYFDLPDDEYLKKNQEAHERVLQDQQKRLVTFITLG